MLRTILSVLAALAILVPAPPADAAADLIVAGPGSQATDSYATPVVVATRAAPLQFRNQDVQPHSVVSDAAGPGTQPWCRFFSGDCPLFWSPVTEAGGRTSEVKGIEGAASGESYGFHCVIHTDVRGTLVAA